MEGLATAAPPELLGHDSFTQKPTQEVVGAAMSSHELPQGRHLLCKILSPKTGTGSKQGAEEVGWVKPSSVRLLSSQQHGEEAALSCYLR